jgi:hypothetical protein
MYLVKTSQTSIGYGCNDTILDDEGGTMDVCVNENMITTAFELPGYRVARSMGLVRGITVRSRSILGTIGASLETLVGGNITIV